MPSREQRPLVGIGVGGISGVDDAGVDDDDDDDDDDSVPQRTSAGPVTGVAADAASSSAVTTSTSESTSTSRSRRLEAAALLVATSLVWVCAGELVQTLALPAFVTWLSCAELSIVLLVSAASGWWLDASGAAAGPEAAARPSAATWRAAAVAALPIAPVFFAAQLSYNASLSGTSLTSTTVISSSSSVFTLAISALYGDAIDRFQVAGVALTAAGTLLAGLNDAGVAVSAEPSGGGGGSGGVTGDLLALAAALFYALYSVALKRALSPPALPTRQPITAPAKPPVQPSPPSPPSATLCKQQPLPASLVLGFVGLHIGLLMWPIALLVEGREALARHVTPTVVAATLVKGLVDNVIASLMWARAVGLSTALLASVGLSLSVPLAAIADAILERGGGAGPLTFAGAALTVAGFVVSAAAPASPEVQGSEGAATAVPSTELPEEGSPDAEEELDGRPASMELPEEGSNAEGSEDSDSVREDSELERREENAAAARGL